MERRPSPARPARSPSPAGVLTRAVGRAAELLGLSQKELAGVLGVSPSTVSRLPARHIEPGSKEGELALLFLRVYRSLDALLGGNVDGCRRWFHARNAHLGAIPAQMIQKVTGLLHVAEYLDAMRGKV